MVDPAWGKVSSRLIWKYVLINCNISSVSVLSIFQAHVKIFSCIPGAQVINIGPFKPLVIALGMWYSTSGLRIKKI